jgi:hypothetical protein
MASMKRQAAMTDIVRRSDGRLDVHRSEIIASRDIGRAQVL